MQQYRRRVVIGKGAFAMLVTRIARNGGSRSMPVARWPVRDRRGVIPPRCGIAA